MVDLALLESAFLTAMGAWLLVLGGAFLLNRGRTIDRVSSILLALAGVYAILWQQPALLGVGEAFHVQLAQPVFLSLLSAAIFLWTYWLFERHADRLEDALSLEQTLVDVLSHDLRNPIAEAQLGVQQLTRSDPQLADDLAGVQANLRKATAVMENGLVYSRLASGAPTLPRQRIDLAELVASAVEAHRERADVKDVTVETRSPSPAPVEASPLIERAVENLLDNAIKFTPEGSTVSIAIETLPGHVRLTVDDEGPGIDPPDREPLLERFARRPDADRGSGLGLAIVRRLVELHDGEMAIEDAPGGGARVGFRIPSTGEGDLCPQPPTVHEAEPDRGWPT